MFNFGMGEMLIIAVIALVFIGPKQLPEVARTIAKLVNEWRRTTADLSQSLMEARDVTETVVREAADDINRQILAEEQQHSNPQNTDHEDGDENHHNHDIGQGQQHEKEHQIENVRENDDERHPTHQIDDAPEHTAQFAVHEPTQSSSPNENKSKKEDV